MENKKIIIVAHILEIGSERLEVAGFRHQSLSSEDTQLYVCDNTVVVVVGIGAEKATRSLRTLLRDGWLDQPAHILLTGSAGSYTIPVLDIVQCNTPHPSIPMDFPTAHLECVHEFVSPSSPHPELHVPFTAFDMESEAIATFLKNEAPDAANTFTIVKVISDDGSGSLGDWASVCRTHVQPRVMDVVLSFINRTTSETEKTKTL